MRSIKVYYYRCLKYMTGICQHAGIAQSVEHFTRNEGVVGSSPISGFIYKTQPGKGLRFVH